MTDLLGAANTAADMTVDVQARESDTSTTRMLRRITESGIRYALLRAPASLHSDVDLIVHPADARKLADALRDQGFVRTPSLRHWPHALFGRFDSGRWLIVDALDRVVLRGTWLGGRRLAAQLVDRSKPDGDGVRQLCPEDRAWAGWLHWAMRAEAAEGAESPDRIKMPVTAPTESHSPMARAMNARARDDVSQRIVDTLRDGNVTSAIALAHVVRGERAPTVARANRLMARWADRSPHRVAARKGRTTGCTIALLGPDGAGKSTLAAGIREALPLPVHLIYMGVFRNDARQLAWRRIPGAGLLLRLCRLWWRSTRARYHRSRGHVVVFDRYVFDATLRPGTRGLRTRLSYWLLERSCPPPDLVLLLDAPGAVMFARKNEHDAQLLEERRQHYLALVTRLPQAHVIDATLPRDQVLAAAVARIWKALTAA